MSRIQVRRSTAAAATLSNPTLAAGEFGYETDTGKVKVGDGTTAWTSLAYLGATSYAAINALAGVLDMATAGVSNGSRRNLGSSGTVTAGTAVFAYFTSVRNLTITQLATMSGNAASSGLTLARLALFTVTNNSDLVIVARTASDTTLLNSTGAFYQRSLATTGGYPASYALVSGTRYAIGLLTVGTTGGSLRVNADPSDVIKDRDPRLVGAKAGLTDFDANVSTVTTYTPGVPWTEAAA